MITNNYVNRLFTYNKKFEASDDPLRPLFTMTVNKYKNKILRYLLYGIFCLHGVVCTAQIADLLATFDSKLLIHYGPSLFFSFFGLVPIIGDAVLYNPYTQLLNKFCEQSWALDQAHPNVIRRIQLESMIIKNWSAVMAVGTFLTIYVHWPIGGQHEDIFYGVELFKRHFADYSLFFIIIIFYGSLIGLGFMITANVLFFVYFVLHLKFQLYLLNDLLKQMSEDYRGYQWMRLGDDEKYQEKIAERLKICVRRHQVFTLLNKELNGVVFIVMVIMCHLGVFFIISVMLYMIAGEYQKINYVLITVTVVTATQGLALFLYAGQSLIDESSKLFENAAQCPWYLWNMKNKKTLLLFLTNTLKPACMGVANLFVCEYSFTIQALHVIGSTCAFFMKVVNRGQ